MNTDWLRHDLHGRLFRNRQCLDRHVPFIGSAAPRFTSVKSSNGLAPSPITQPPESSRLRFFVVAAVVNDHRLYQLRRFWANSGAWLAMIGGKALPTHENAMGKRFAEQIPVLRLALIVCKKGESVMASAERHFCNTHFLFPQPFG